MTAPILGPRTEAHLTEALGAVELTLTEDEHAALDTVAPPGAVTVPYYGHDGMAWVPWGPHQHRW